MTGASVIIEVQAMVEKITPVKAEALEISIIMQQGEATGLTFVT